MLYIRYSPIILYLTVSNNYYYEIYLSIILFNSYIILAILYDIYLLASILSILLILLAKKELEK